MQKGTINVLLIDDDEDDFILIRQMLSHVPAVQFNMQWAPTYDAGFQELAQDEFDAILLDYDLGLHDGIEWTREAVDKGVEIPIIIVTGRGSYEKDVEAMEAGAVDYLSKNELSGYLLERTVRYALEHRHIEAELERRVQARTQELVQTTEELYAALEELRVYQEELRENNQDLLEANQKVEIERQHYQELFLYAPFGYLVTNKLGIIRDLNKKAAWLLGNTTEYLQGKPLAVYIASGDRSAFRNFIDQLNKEGQIDVLIQPGKGKALTLSLTAVPVHKPSNQPGSIHWLLEEPRAER